MEEKILKNLLYITPYLTAGTITLIFGFIKLISDNQSKISDYRRDWNESLRLSISKFNASVQTIIGRIFIEGDENIDTKDIKSELRQHWYELRESHNIVKLHFNKPIYQTEIESFKEKLVEKDLGRLSKNIINIISSKYLCLLNKSKNSSENSELLKILESDEAALLLTMWATENLIEKENYKEIKKDSEIKNLIEQGSHTILTISSKVLLDTWKKVKTGERRYSIVLWVSLFIIIAFIFLIIYIFIKSP